MGRLILIVLALAGCMEPGRDVPPVVPTPTGSGLGRDGGTPPAVPAVPEPAPDQACRLVPARARELCADRPDCPVRTGWAVDCHREIRGFDLAVSPHGRVLAVVESMAAFVLEAGSGRDPSLSYTAAGGLTPVFTGHEPPEPRLYSPYGIMRPANPGWQLQTGYFGRPGRVADVALIAGEAGFALVADEAPQVGTLWLVSLPPSEAPAIMVARGAIVYHRLLVGAGGVPTVVYAERGGGELRVRRWTPGGAVDLHVLAPRSDDVAFSAALAAGDRPVVLYNDDGAARLVGEGAPGPLFTPAAFSAPTCERCGDDDGERYAHTDVGERASGLHALAAGTGLWSALVTGPGRVYCEARGCQNRAVLESSLWTLRLRNHARPGPDVLLQRQWSRDPIALEVDDAGLLYVAWKSYKTFYLFVIDPAGP
jgi:hypothetical protein